MPDFEITGDEAQKAQEDEAKKKEAIAVEALMKEYESARTFDEEPRKQYAVNRSYAAGKALEAWASSANLIGSFIDILTSFLYARDPEVSTKAAKNVGGSTKNNADFAETLGIVVSRTWKQSRLKKAARKMVRSSLSVGPGWLKVIMTHETRRDPEVQAQLNDLEDNVQRIRATQAKLAEDDLDQEEQELEIQKLQLQRTALKARLEVVHRRGLAIDFVQADDMQVSTDVADLSDHLDANWNANDIYISLEDAPAEFERLSAEDFKTADKYYQRKSKPKKDDNMPDMGFADSKEETRYVKSSEDKDGMAFVRVTELWDKRDNHIKTFIWGVKRWAVEPYTPPYATSRYYPYFNLSLFEVDGERHPQSLTGRLLKLQDEYSSRRSNSRLAAERSVPGIIFNAQGLSPKDAKKIEAAVAQEMVGIEPVGGDDIRKLFTEKPVAKIDPMIFSTGAIMSDMERVAGVQEALSQSVATPKTATEAKIQQTGFTSRTGADRDTLEDVLQDLAVYTSELAIQAYPTEYVRRIAGPAAYWPEGMNVEDLLTLAEVEIKAGSTGKPDDESLRQSWSVLLPLVQQAMAAIQEAQMTGNLPMAEALRNLIKETMRRLDERIDVEQFIPQGALQDLRTEGPADVGSAPAEPAVDQAQAAADANTLV